MIAMTIFPHSSSLKKKDQQPLKENLQKIFAEIFQYYPFLTQLFLYKNTDNATLKEHTEEVIKQFYLQKEFYHLNSPHFLSRFPNLETLLTASLLLHDIGKPIGGSKNQHFYTIPIHNFYLNSWGHLPHEVQLAEELINHDLLGLVIQGTIRVEEAAKQLRQKAYKVGLPLKDFFQLQTLIYVSDASSYPDVRKKVFQENSQSTELSIQGELFLSLQNLLESQ